VFEAAGLPYIEPELREDRGEIEAAENARLPRLVTVADIRGDLHVHTRASDGKNTLEEMAEAAQALGYEYLAIADHSKHATRDPGPNSRFSPIKGRHCAVGARLGLLRSMQRSSQSRGNARCLRALASPSPS
jgi:hypothetical protein